MFFHSTKDIDECKLSDPCDPRTSQCENFEGGYRCVCKTGFMKAYNGLICIDRNECDEKTALCEQECKNTFGGYSCSCKKGYRLAADQKNCDGECIYFLKTFFKRNIFFIRLKLIRVILKNSKIIKTDLQ